MIDGLTPYPAYKDSGVPWLGEVPAHWEIRKLKHLTRFHNGIAFKPIDWAHSGVPIIRIQNLNGSNLFNYTIRSDLPGFLRIRRGDLLFSWSGNRGTSFGPFIWTRDFDGYLNQHIFKLDGYSLNRRYFAHLLRAVTRHIEEQSHGIIGLVHVTKPELGAVMVPVASPVEQIAVVRFLDHADRRIRLYIRAKQKLIKLLVEQRQAIIHRAVTRGLDPNVRLKPSGPEPLGDVPAHWEMWQIGHMGRVGNGSTPSRGNSAYWADGTYPWLNSSCANHRSVTKAEQFVTDITLRECHLPIVPEGSVLVAITGQGKTRGKATVLRIEATINQHLAFITPKTSICSADYLQLALEGAYLHLRSISDDSGSTRGALT